MPALPKKNGVDVVRIKHDYDYAGNRLNRQDAVNAASSELYGYDQLNQITSLERGALNANRTEVPSPSHSESWLYDKLGNWLSYFKNGTTETRTHNSANEIQNACVHDANGNMTIMPGLKAKYDAWDRIVEVRDSSDVLIADYQYNGRHQRIAKTISEVTTRSFFNDEWQELESQTANEITTYVWGFRYLDDLAYQQKGIERLYSLADPNWNVVAIADSIGDVQERYVYDAFGNRLIFNAAFTPKASSDYAWNRTFTGQVHDPETGLMNYRNRCYSVIFGRFVQRDPIGFDGGDINLYRYVANRPVHSQDSHGLFKNDQDTFNDWYDDQANMDWAKGLPPCPCKAKISKGYWSDDISLPRGRETNKKKYWEIEKRRYSWYYHPGADFCMRSKADAGKPSSQCCYDTDGRLITSGMSAGTADRNDPGHWPADVDPFDLAWKLDGNCYGKYSEMYFERRPAIGANRCKPNPKTPENKKCPEDKCTETKK